ncbi:MFS transporter [Streptomyces sp. Wh19]|uniref:MFS transporter n=1 Tax=Streptomyces sp. Wh19 TaxID=3076629 RepID=UPI0029589217|nr:MFS transporter [Streptomyces sp. Wh19]MDV9198185.1 MFS transporter [Streptomyces sp. Wh19]
MVSIFAVELGTSITAVALPLLLVRDYGTTLAAGLTLAIRLIPNMAAGPIVGRLLARRDPRHIVMFSSLLSALFAALIPVCGALWQIQILTFGIGLTAMFAGPARFVLRPAVVSEGDERRGNGLLMAAQRVSTLSGPPLVGVIVAIGWPLWIAFLLEAASALVAVVMMLRVPPLPSAADEEAESTGAEGHGAFKAAYVTTTRALLRAISDDAFIRGATLTSFSYVLAVTLGRMMLVVMGAQHYSDVSGFYGWMLAAMGAGGLCGSLLTARFKQISTGTLYVAVMLIEAVGWLSLPWLPNFSVAMAVMFTIGIMESAGYVLYYAEVQIRIPRSLMGYYYAACIPVIDACVFLGSAFGASLAGASVSTAAMVVAGAMGIPMLLTSRWYFTPPGGVSDTAVMRDGAKSATRRDKHEA